MMFLKGTKKKSKQSCLNQTRDKIAFYLLRKEVKTMVVVYATLIIKGKKTIGDIPSVIQQQVKDVLIDMDLPELAE
ncbi:hypothetical protein HMPREF1370_01740 [Enterococcus faecium P1123]|jgi:hypothetical protein|nr:hypothetical protein HMPREF1372_03271 [Enterococcus faecium P1139]EJX80340.1 hypothetical protein HMPREF1370_01740 [Enterococcus faecium P1123]EJY34851.1 hypothetical protein HMPREF1352_02069 [Enterococcus faecium 511]